MELYESFWIFFFPFLVVAIIWIATAITDKKVAKIMRSPSEFPLIPISEASTVENQISRRLIAFNIRNISVYRDIINTWKRKYLIRRSKIRLKKNLLYNLVAGLGYLIFPIAMLILMPGLNKGEPEESMLAGVLISCIMGIVFIVYHIFYYTTFVKEIELEKRAELYQWPRALVILVRFIAGIYGFIFRILVKFVPRKLTVFYPLMLFFLLSSLIVNMIWRNWGIIAGIIMAFGFHVFIHTRLHNWAKSEINYKLLILRVFNIQSSTNFIFRNIWKYWRHIGSYFTVVDESLMQLQKRKIWVNFIPIIISVWFVILIVGMALRPVILLILNTINEFYVEIIIESLIALPLITYLGYNNFKISQSFIKSEGDLTHNIAILEKKPFGLLLTYKESPVKCFDNTWSYVVSEFVQLADVILMDLRGYSESRKGCRQELNLLVNLVPFTKITFLVGESDLLKVKQLLVETCQNINSISLNFKNDNIQINIYNMSGVEELDSEVIVALLIDSLQISESYR